MDKGYMAQNYETPFPDFKSLSKYLCKAKYDKGWAFRAQPKKFPLRTTLERSCEKWGLTQHAPEIEKTMIREFRRVYDGKDRETVERDTLYCLSLLRHYGAPVRLLDFTYSKYIALYFGLECAYSTEDRGIANMVHKHKEVEFKSEKKL